MKNQYKTYAPIFLAFIFASTSVAQGPPIWDQIPDDTGSVLANQELPGFPEFNTYLVNDFQVDSELQMTGISVYFTNTNESWMGNVTQARFSFTSDPSGDNYNPFTEGEIVPVTITEVETGVIRIFAEKQLSIPAGTHWIGLSPVADLSAGQEFHLSGGFQGDVTRIRNPGGGFGLGTEWMDATVFNPTFQDFAFTIHGAKLTEQYYPESLIVFRGNQQSGDLTSLQGDDDNRAVFTPGYTINSAESPITLIMQTTVADLGEDAALFVDSQSTTPNLTITVEQWNWATQSYELVGQLAESFELDQLHVFNGLTPHLNDSSEVRARIGWKPKGVTKGYPWEVKIDQVYWACCGQ